MHLLIAVVVIVILLLLLLQQTRILHTRMRIVVRTILLTSLHTNMCCNWVENVCGRLFKTTCVVPDCIEWITKKKNIKRKFFFHQIKIKIFCCAFVLCLKGKFFFREIYLVSWGFCMIDQLKWVLTVQKINCHVRIPIAIYMPKS